MSDKRAEMELKDEIDPLNTPYDQSVEEHLAELLMKFIRKFRRGLNHLIPED